jgi:hypothetical protein
MVGYTRKIDGFYRRADVMPQVVAHVRKVKTTVGMAHVVGHNSRVNVYDEEGNVIQSKQSAGDWFDPTRSDFNRIDPLVRSQGSLSPVYAKRDQIIAKAEEDTIKAGGKWRKPSKSAAAAVEIILSFSSSWMGKDGWTDSPVAKEKIDTFMKKGREWITEKYGLAVLHMAEHWDEKTPHLHAVLVPITKNSRPPRTGRGGEILKVYDPPKAGAWRYSSGDFFGGATGLREFQDEIARVMAPLGLDRGTVKSRAKHTNLSHHAKEVEDLVKAIEEKEQDLKEVEGRHQLLESQVQTFQKSMDTKLRGWQMPEAKALESAKKYRDRVAYEVMGKIARALDTYDQAATQKKDMDEEKKVIAAAKTRMEFQMGRLEGKYGDEHQAEEYLAQKKALQASRRPSKGQSQGRGY